MDLLHAAVLAGSIIIGVAHVDVLKKEEANEPPELNCEDINEVPQGATPGPLQQRCDQEEVK
jgi:hypothetical protein